MLRYFLSFLLVAVSILSVCVAGLDHAKVARRLVHQADWAAVGTISTNSKITGFPMVNVVSIDDSNSAGESTGLIHFMLTDLDFTGRDYRALNKVTFLFTDEQNKNCANIGRDPMEPTCARAIISGQIKQMDRNAAEYQDYLDAFIKRHPAAISWLQAPAFHAFYLAQLEIENIFVLDFYGGPQTVTVEQYLNANPDHDVA